MTHPILLVGSVPLATNADVFKALGEELGPLAARYPDGETGVRTQWIRWQRHVFDDNPQLRLFEEGQHPGYGQQKVAQPFYALKDGADLNRFAFKTLGYAATAIESYRIFAELKQAGVVPARVKFQVSLPSVVSLLSSFVVEADRAKLEPALEAAMRAEVDDMTAKIPAQELAIQWDCASEVIAHDSGRALHYPDVLFGSVDRIARLVSFVPQSVEVGVHLCYGDPGHKHIVEPRDTATCVAFANAIWETATRKIDWIHLPIPRGWDEDGYYEPLERLRRPAGAQIFIGLVHFTDGIEGTERRLALARRHIADFGIATECGFGRRDPATVRPLLQIHRAVASDQA